MESLKPYLQTVYWKDIRERMRELNPEFTALVDDIDPGKEFPLYLAKYRYGDVIVREGDFYLPTPDEGKLVRPDDASIPAEVRNGLAFTKLMFAPGIVLTNSMQLNLGSNFNFTSWFLNNSGAIFALWKRLGGAGGTFHPSKLFTITAGARSLIMTPNIGDFKFHKNLRLNYKLSNLPIPKDVFDHWPLFVSLARSQIAKCDWHTQLVFFSENWIKKINSKDLEWLKLSHYLLCLAWNHSDFWRNKALFDYAFSHAKMNRNLRPNPYIADTAKHLITLTFGVFPGFTPAIDNTAGPIELLQKIYLEDYRLTKYVPTIMQPGCFSPEKSRKPIYYSLNCPSTFEFSPKSRKFVNNLYDLRELKHVMEKVVDEIKCGRLRLDNTPIMDLMHNVNFDYFHNKNDKYGEVRPAEEIASEDPDLIKSLVTTKNKTFASNGAFFRSCIRVSTKSQDNYSGAEK
ncbi:MAG: hypothetical protein M1561_00625 [Gammaproteobacteria bacterium]|nr:hypothetical protein [Gammaproteobacteria bacterium]